MRLTVLLLALIASTADAGEVVFVKYRGNLDLAPFACEWTPKSSVVKRLCYDAQERYLVVNLTGTYYHYCEMPRADYMAWRNADSLGSHFNARIKGNFGCQGKPVPDYKR